MNKIRIRRQAEVERLWVKCAAFCDSRGVETRDGIGIEFGTAEVKEAVCVINVHILELMVMPRRSLLSLSRRTFIG